MNRADGRAVDRVAPCTRARVFRAFEVGDVDILWHDGLFHLFHLVLPNHDFIAHAVSEDGLTWRRVNNALFISDPGAFDDDMLWTMHVSADPHGTGWRMFYTGLCLRENGRVQRVGIARSDDLYHWEKVTSTFLPIEAPADGYENSAERGREWVSFRDPFFVEHGGQGYLLVAARVDSGPMIRRGAVALGEEVAPGRFEFRQPLFHPGRYDDVEVPGVFELGGRFYLLGSIREDRKVHYWYADDFFGPYRNYSDNVLMPQGNYAARVCQDRSEDRKLVWSFFFRNGDLVEDRLLPPPKEIVVENGHLRLRSYRGFDAAVTGKVEHGDVMPLEALFGHPGGFCGEIAGGCRMRTDSGFEAFLLRGLHRDYRLSGTLHVVNDGKLGLIMHVDEEGDGYYISLDPVKAIAQIRYWSSRPGGTVDDAFEYRQLQAAFHITKPGPIPFLLISFGTYIELSLHGDVILALSDDRRQEGRVGFYVESAEVRITDLEMELLDRPLDTAYVTQDPGAHTTEKRPA